MAFNACRSFKHDSSGAVILRLTLVVMLFIGIPCAASINVKDQTELQTAIDNDYTVINLQNDIIFTQGSGGSTNAISIASKSASITINGNGFRASFETSVSSNGRCFYINSATVVMNDMNVSNCYYNHNTLAEGGGLYVADATLVMNRCEIRKSFAYRGPSCTYKHAYGGGMYIYNSVVDLKACIIDDNNANGYCHSSFGGGIYIQDSVVSLTTTELTNNYINPSANSGGSGVVAYGAGIYVTGASSDVDCNGCYFARNEAAYGGIGNDVYIDGGASFSTATSGCPNEGGSGSTAGELDTNSGTYYSYKCNLSPTATPSATRVPTLQPTALPTLEPTALPTLQPTALPTLGPTLEPTVLPTLAPTLEPTALPTLVPTLEPTAQPTLAPTLEPSPQPTALPTLVPTLEPTVLPSLKPTPEPTAVPTLFPSLEPTALPSLVPTLEPTALPSIAPTQEPTSLPSLAPTPEPTALPTLAPTLQPSHEPTLRPTLAPSLLPTLAPSHAPSLEPTALPTLAPTPAPTSLPSRMPTFDPTLEPSSPPTLSPTQPPMPVPTSLPTLEPTPLPTIQPTAVPSPAPTAAPSSVPSTSSRPTAAPSANPTSPPSLQPTALPSSAPTLHPTPVPSATPAPTASSLPSSAPTISCEEGQYYVISLGICLWCGSGKFSDTTTLVENRGACVECPTGTYSTTRSSSCTLCSPGSYADSTGSSSCTVCPIGRIITTSGDDGGCRLCPAGKINHDANAADATLHDDASDCTACDGIRFSSADRSQCVACPGGSYIFNASACEWCPSGKYAPTAAFDDCITCSAGMYTQASMAALTCTACDAGSFSRVLAVNCTACAAGKSSRTRAADCTPCDPGFYSSAPGQSTCTACSGGSATGQVFGATTCSSCLQGRYQAETGQAVCLSCPRGTYMSSSGSMSCRDCSAGFFVNATGSTACVACPAGRAQPETGTSACRDCSTGTYADISASSACSKCSAGRYQDSAGAAACLACAAGRATAIFGQPSCEECEQGKYASAAGASSCVQCERAKYSLPASTNCSICAVGYFRHEEKCHECEEGDWVGTSCDRSGLRLETVTLKPGYWRTSSTSDEVLSCAGKREAACIGGNKTEKLCAEGHWGPWCSNCADSHYSPDKGKCEPCTGESKSTMIIIGAVALAVVITAIVARCVYLQWRSTHNEEDLAWRPEDHPDVIHRSSVLKLILIFAQAIASLQEVFDMGFPQPFGHIVEISRVIAIDFAPLADATPLRCLTGHVVFYSTLVTMTLGPLFVVLLRLVWFCRGRSAFLRHGVLSDRWANCQSDVVVILFLMQPAASKVSFQTFVCTDRFDDGEIFLTADLSLKCDTAEHAAYSAYAGLMVLVWPVGVTLLFGTALYRNRNLILFGSAANKSPEDDAPGQHESGRSPDVMATLRGGGDDENERRDPKAATVVSKESQLFVAMSECVNEYLDGQIHGISGLFHRLDGDKDGQWSGLELQKALDFLIVSRKYRYSDEEVGALYHTLASSHRQHAGAITLDSFSWTMALRPSHNPRLRALELLLTYRETVFAWELVVIVRRVIMNAGLVVIGRGESIQAVVATFVAFIGTALQARYFPFEDDRENHLALGMDTLLLFCLQFGLLAGMESTSSLKSTPWRVVGVGLALGTAACVLYGVRLALSQALMELLQKIKQHYTNASGQRTEAMHRGMTRRKKRSSVQPELAGPIDIGSIVGGDDATFAGVKGALEVIDMASAKQVQDAGVSLKAGEEGAKIERDSRENRLSIDGDEGNGDALPPGWTVVPSRTRPGEVSFKNTETGAVRQRHPLGIAKQYGPDAESGGGGGKGARNGSDGDSESSTGYSSDDTPGIGSAILHSKARTRLKHEKSLRNVHPSRSHREASEADGKGRGGDEDPDHSDLKVDNDEQEDTKGPVKELTGDEEQAVGDEGPIQTRSDSDSSSDGYSSDLDHSSDGYSIEGASIGDVAGGSFVI